MDQLTEYAEKILSGTKPILGVLIGACNYILFPNQAFFTAACAVGGAILLDIFTKYIALSKKAGGYRKAVFNKTISSNKLWEGTKIKLYTYLVVAILAGLSYRVIQLEQVGVFVASVVYSIIFLREAQSCFENVCDAGGDLKWAVLWTKKKQRDILNTDGSVPGEDDNNAKTI